MRKCIIPISGGLDSTVLLYYATMCTEFDEIHTISFDYGQKHVRELEYAKRTIAKFKNVTHKTVNIPFFKDIATGTSLLNDNIAVAKTRDVLGDAQTVNYVPFRNLMLLSISCAYAETLKADTVFHGAAQVDTQAGFWDGSIEFLDSINNLISLNRKNKIEIRAPLIYQSKAQIISKGISIGVDFNDTWTCYEGKDTACGECTSCSSRIKGFIDNKIIDPIEYSRHIPWSDYNCVHYENRV